jgi:hypothetical protein
MEWELHMERATTTKLVKDLLVCEDNHDNYLLAKVDSGKRIELKETK